MAETLTPNYSWTKPDPGASANTWGATLNKDLDGIDAQVYANQQAGLQGAVPIGSITMFAGATPPTNWLMCDGSSLATTGTYAALFAIIGYAFGGSGANFSLPDLRGKFPLGAGPSNALASAAGSYSYTIGVANLPSHAHPITDVAHNHGVNQSPHAHGDPGHTHGVSDPGHQHTVANVALGSGTNIQPGAGFNQVGTLGTSVNGTGVSIQAAGTGIQAANANVSLNASGTGLSTTQVVGSGTPMSIIPSYVAINLIIKFR